MKRIIIIAALLFGFSLLGFSQSQPHTAENIAFYKKELAKEHTLLKKQKNQLHALEDVHTEHEASTVGITGSPYARHKLLRSEKRGIEDKEAEIRETLHRIQGLSDWLGMSHSLH